MKKIFKNEKESIKDFPDSPGVYMFLDEFDSVLYVGKAKILKNRLRSYFSTHLEPKTRAMVGQAQTISIITVQSEIEALLLEARLVKKYRPKYNIELRDDKSPLYIGITKEEFPRVVLLRQTQLKDTPLKKVYGPFLNAQEPKKVLKMFRRVVPFATHKPTRRACIYHELGLCDPCPSIAEAEDKKQYVLQINRLQKILSGNIRSVQRSLEKQLKKTSDALEFEKSQQIAHKLASINYILNKNTLPAAYMENPNLVEDIRSKEKQELQELLQPIYSIDSLTRIECFDIAHISGAFPTASMVTFINGEPDKSFYRHFKVKTQSNNDTASLKEVLIRRKKYFASWGRPDLIIIDGGKGQVKTTKQVIKTVPLVGLAKRFETLIFLTDEGEFIEKRVPRGHAKNLLQRLRNEAHRFARRYHHQLVSKNLIP